MEEIIKIPSRIIPGKKIFISGGLSTLGLVSVGIVTTAKLANEKVLDAQDAYEKQVLNLNTKHNKEIKEKESEYKAQTEKRDGKKRTDDINWHMKQIGRRRKR